MENPLSYVDSRSLVKAVYGTDRNDDSDGTVSIDAQWEFRYNKQKEVICFLGLWRPNPQ